MADLVATKSKDPSTKVGVVVVGTDNQVLSTGYNGFPRGVREGALIDGGSHNNIESDELDSERWARPAKYLFVEHAERNAIQNAARTGVSLKGSTMYFNFEPCPCNECAKAVIGAGIQTLVGYKRPFPGKGAQWEESLRVAKIMLNEAGVWILELNE
ncbi:MAG: hypothetical protein GY794_16155 [bacterium]|nr:hypothetical protein [bacterium]